MRVDRQDCEDRQENEGRQENEDRHVRVDRQDREDRQGIGLSNTWPRPSGRSGTRSTTGCVGLPPVEAMLTKAGITGHCCSMGSHGSVLPSGEGMDDGQKNGSTDGGKEGWMEDDDG